MTLTILTLTINSAIDTEFFDRLVEASMEISYIKCIFYEGGPKDLLNKHRLAGVLASEIYPIKICSVYPIKTLLPIQAI